MVQSQQMNPGMVVAINSVIYRVESCVKVTVPKGAPFIKAKLREVNSGKVVEKSFKLNAEVKEVNLEEKNLEFLYAEDKDFLFLDFAELEQVLVPGDIVGEKILYLKEGTKVTASFYGGAVFAIELPQFLELMVSNVSQESSGIRASNGNLIALLETGAKVEIPAFVDVGDIIKVDTKLNEYVQRV